MDSEEKRKPKSETETLQKLCLNRKKQNFDALKQWDQMRAHKLMTHRKVADQIQENLHETISQSNQFLRVVIQFLLDYQSLYKKYENPAVTNPESKLQANAVSRNIHFTTSKCLTRLYKSTQNQKNYKKIRSILENGVKNIENMLTESERDIMQIRTKIQLKAVEIQNQNGLTIERCDQIADSYNRDKTTKVFQAESDLFNIQQQFLQQSISQTKTQQSYGQLVVEFLDCVEDYQKKKLELVRQTLENFLLATNQNNEDKENVKSLLDILQKRTQNEIIQSIYSSEQFVSKQIIKQLRRAENISQFEKIDLITIKNYLTKIVYHPFDSRNLVLKEYKTYTKNEQELENSYLLVTVDAYINIYQYKDQFDFLEAKPKYTLKCSSNIDMVREGEINLNVSLTRWHIINMSKQTIESVKLVFLSEDQRQEFIQFIGKII